MKRTIIVCLCLTALFSASAKDMRELWLGMPDSLIGYMDKSKRLALLDHVDMNTTAELRVRQASTRSLATSCR